MDLSMAADTWNTDGYVVLPGYIPSDELRAAVSDLPALFPTRDEFHDAVDPERNARFIGDEFNGIDVFPFGSLAINRLPVCQAMIDLATTFLGSQDVRLYSAEAWGKYEGAADYDQSLHRDYLNHTVLVPSADPRFQQPQPVLVTVLQAAGSRELFEASGERLSCLIAVGTGIQS